MDKEFDRRDRALITMPRLRNGSSRFMDLKTGFGLKSTIGSEKELASSFINSFFKDKGEITNIEFLDKKVLSSIIDNKMKIADVLCDSVLGGQFIVELLFLKKPIGLDVVKLYTSQAFCNGLPKEKLGKLAATDDGHLPVYFLALLDFELENSAPGGYFHKIQLRDEEKGSALFNKLGYIYLELPRFTKDFLDGEEANRPSDMDKWLYAIKNLAALEEDLPGFLKAAPFNSLLEISEVAMMEKKRFKKYEKCLRRLLDEECIRGDAFNDGVMEGERRLEKAQQAYQQEKEAIIKKLLELDMLDLAQIASICAVEQHDVLKLQQSAEGHA